MAQSVVRNTIAILVPLITQWQLCSIGNNNRVGKTSTSTGKASNRLRRNLRNRSGRQLEQIQGRSSTTVTRKDAVGSFVRLVDVQQSQVVRSCSSIGEIDAIQHPLVGRIDICSIEVAADISPKVIANTNFLVNDLSI